MKPVSAGLKLQLWSSKGSGTINQGHAENTGEFDPVGSPPPSLPEPRSASSNGHLSPSSGVGWCFKSQKKGVGHGRVTKLKIRSVLAL